MFNQFPTDFPSLFVLNFSSFWNRVLRAIPPVTLAAMTNVTGVLKHMSLQPRYSALPVTQATASKHMKADYRLKYTQVTHFVKCILQLTAVALLL